MAATLEQPRLQETQTSGWLPIIHLQHPNRPGEAWCGAEVFGQTGRWRLDCIVCTDLRRLARQPGNSS
jgi:hypothetical protein